VALQKLFDASEHFRARFTFSAVVDAAKQVKDEVANEQRWWTSLLEGVKSLHADHRPMAVPKPVATPRLVNGGQR
jgi:hypothetical protein